ncbi:MAG: hypothetical protein H0V47_10795 [Chloroflexia bacterium]|jgi:hypothetical protein|nr:hypothetical protein [Chloroflexia bacterium]
MAIPDEVVLRWKAATRALGIRLTDEDIERIGASGIGDRITMLDEIAHYTGSRDVVPDYLADTRKMGSDDEY